MQLSVIIVNYNVRHFLEQCLYAVRKATSGLQAEVIVVDNHSSDNSLAYLQDRFKDVRFIANKENLGFAKACNQGWKASAGEFVLFLNPDCIVPENCFEQCIAFLKEHPEAGALGVKMLDGKGQFLKESKRSFPSPVTSLYKLFGLAKLFPRSKIFSRYHLGHLNENSNHEVDVLAGAFMMLKRKVLEQTRGFDESFFMYGEDVDLSYRIQQAGYKNYYFSGTSIIHFKGESTRKSSMNYVRMFYNAMSIFVKKHYGGSRASVFHFLIHLAIWMRATLTAVGQFVRRIGLPLIDAGLILLSFWLVKNCWNEYVRTDVYYENRLLWIAFPAYTLFYLITAYYAGLYDRWYKWTELARSSLIATVVLLAAYALLPEHLRYSRAIILFGSLLAFLFIALLRWLLIQAHVLNSYKEKKEHSSTVIAGTAAEYESVMQLLKEAGLQQKVLGRIAVTDTDVFAIGSVAKLKELLAVVPVKEIIFCEGTLPYSRILQLIPGLAPAVRIKFHAAGSRSIVGSDSKNSSGEALSFETTYNLDAPYYRRIKRLTDVILALFFLLSFPLHFIAVKKPFHFLRNCLLVLLAQKTWIGYATEQKRLPRLRPAILSSNGIPLSMQQVLPEESLQLLDYWYAKDYEPTTDLRLLWKMYRRLGD